MVDAAGSAGAPLTGRRHAGLGDFGAGGGERLVVDRAGVCGHTRKMAFRNRLATSTSPWAVPPLMRPKAVSTKEAGSNSRMAGRSETSPGATVTPSGSTEMRVVPPLRPETRTPMVIGWAPGVTSTVYCQSTKATG